MKVKPGDKVRLNVPENERLHRATAEVSELTDWGAHIRTEAAATGNFRALWSEMEPLNGARNGHASVARAQGYEGDPCPTCGALHLRRNGACLLCDLCGSTSGCS